MAKKKKMTKVAKAQGIIRAQVKAGNQRASVVQHAVNRAGISTRTYRTARKTMRAVAVRKNRRKGNRGSGMWYVSLS